jgi:hypothetical protein
MDENEYQTSDLSLVAALCTLGAKIDFVEHSSPRSIFHIEHLDGLDRLVTDFYSRDLLVEPLAYFNALRDAKTRLYGGASRRKSTYL